MAFPQHKSLKNRLAHCTASNYTNTILYTIKSALNPGSFILVYAQDCSDYIFLCNDLLH